MTDTPNLSSFFYLNPLPSFFCERGTLKILEVNQAAQVLYGYPQEELLKRTLLSLTSVGEVAKLQKELTSISEREGSIDLGVYTHHKMHGEAFEIELKGYFSNEYITFTCTEFKKKQEATSAAENLLNASLDVITSIDEKGRFIKVSAASLKHWGYAPEELEGIAYMDLVHPEDVAITNKVAAEIIAGKNYTTFENRYITKKGTIAYNLWSAYWDPISKVMYAVARDGFEKKVIEQVLIDSESRFKSLVQEGLDLIGILDANGKYSYVSPTSKRVLGIDPEVFLGKSPFDFIHPHDAENVLACLGLTETQHRVEITPFRFQNKQGEWRWIKTVLTNMTTHPTIKGIVANSRDITEQINEQNRLKLLESVVTNTSDAILITDANKKDASGRKILFVNEAFTKMTGYTADEVIGKSPRLLQGPKSDQAALAKLKAALDQYEPCEVTTINYKKNGDEYWVNFTVTPIANEKGKYTHWVAIQRDITDKKIHELEQNLLSQISQIFNEEKKLKKATQRLCSIFDYYGDFDFVEVWIPNIENNLIHLMSFHEYSDLGTQFYQYSETLKQLKIGYGLIGNVMESKKAVVLDLNTNHALFVRQEAAKSAGIATVLSIPLLFKDTVVGVLAFGSSKTVSELHHYLHIFQKLETFIGSEINRKSLESNLVHLFQAIPDIICITDYQGKFLKINRAGCDLLGYTEDEILLKTFDDFVHPNYRDKTISNLREWHQGGHIFKLENRYLTKKGEILWLSWTCNLEVSEGLIYASAKNITEEKKLSELHEEASSLAKIGSWEIDLIKDKLFWSPIVHELHETDPNTYFPSLEDGINFYREDFKDRVTDCVQQCIATGKSFNIEAVIITFKKQERWVRVLGQAEFLDGKGIRIYGSFQDIHEKKMSEELLLKSFEDKNKILESIGDGFFALDKNFTVTYWNKEAEQLLGKKREEVLFKNLWELYSELQDSEFNRQYHRALETGDTVFFEDYNPLISKWFEVTAYPSNEGLSVYFKDITLRKEADLSLQKANERFEKVTQATNDVIWDWDIENGTFFRSQGIENFFGSSSPKLLYPDNFWKDNFHPDDLKLIQESLNEAIQNPNTLRWEMEYRILKENGQIGYVVDKGLIVRNHDGKAIRMVGAMTDISERKWHEAEALELNQSLKKYTEKLEKTNEQLEQFAFIASHDLQEPLRMVTSFLDQLKRKYHDQLDDKAQLYIHFATDAAKRMRQIIVDLLEYSRAGRTDEGIEVVDMNEIISDFKLLRSQIIFEKNATILAADLPKILIYKVPLLQTLHCVLDNAIKYSKPDVPPVIKVTAMEKEGKWIIAIEDNGIGIEKAYYHKIFVIFQRLHNREEYDGTGIGLALSKKHVDSWGGNIWVESKVGKGTTVFFSIPKQ